MAKRKRTNNDLQNITQKDRQYNSQKKKDKQWSTKHYTEGHNTLAKSKRTNNDLQNITQKDRQYTGQKKKDKQSSTKHYTEK